MDIESRQMEFGNSLQLTKAKGVQNKKIRTGVKVEDQEWHRDL